MIVNGIFVFDDTEKTRYLAHLESSGLPAKAARAIGTTSSRVKIERERDVGFDEACDESMLLFRESIEAEIHRRAIEGYDEPVFYQGLATGECIRKYSDSLLQFLGKAKLSEYGDKLKVDQTITGGVLLTAAPAASTEAWLESVKPKAELTDGSEHDDNIIDVESVDAKPVPV
jgi:hypothetical protein